MMHPARNLNLLERVVASAFTMVNRLRLGVNFGPALEAYIEIHGVRGFMEHTKLFELIVQELGEVYGPFEAQLAVGMAGFFNGCRFCAIGHIKSANLILFRDEALLSPVDEADLVEIMVKSDMKVLEEMLLLLEGDRYAVARGMLESLFRMRFGYAEPVTDEDHLLIATIAFWDWTNECTINMGVDREEYNMPSLYLLPGKKLQRSYDAARAASRVIKAVET